MSRNSYYDRCTCDGYVWQYQPCGHIRSYRNECNGRVHELEPPYIHRERVNYPCPQKSCWDAWRAGTGSCR